MTRMISKAACRQLASFLSKQEITCERLGVIFNQPFATKGSALESLYQCVDEIARKNKLSQKGLDRIEKEVDGDFSELFKELAVAMEFTPPKCPVVRPADLKRLTTLAKRARVHEDPHYTRLKAGLDPDLLEHSAVNLLDSGDDQVGAWFDAANRQAVKAGDQPWMIGLVTRVAEQCLDEALRRTLESARDSLQEHALAARETPWELPEFEPAAPPSPEQPRAVPPAGLGAGPPKVGLALAVGVGKYIKTGDEDPERVRRGFTNLRCAARDAEDLAAFLRDHQDIDFRNKGRVQCLVDDQATLRNIMRGLDSLRGDCLKAAEPDPLVLVYFSGHGMPDLAGRHYLVPHDGDPDELFSTALWNSTFNAALEQIPTRRLVVLLDACHAEAMAPEGAKDGASLLYDPRDASGGLSCERGRYFIASCATGQRSFEADENGVFTQALLALLRFEDLKYEQLDLADLYGGLRMRVDVAARNSRGHSQTPTANFPEGAATGIILAVNRSRELMQERFRDSVFRYLKQHRPPQFVTIEARINECLSNSLSPERARALETFFGLFTEAADLWQGPQDENRIRDLCQDLARQLGVKEQSRVAPGGRPQDTLTESKPGLDLGAFRAPAPPLAPPAGELRSLRREDVRAILELVPDQAEFVPTRLQLESLLSRPAGVGENQFIKTLFSAREQILDHARRHADSDEERQQLLEALQPQVDELIGRLADSFKRAWKTAGSNSVRGVVGIRAMRGT